MSNTHRPKTWIQDAVSTWDVARWSRSSPHDGMLLVDGVEALYATAKRHQGTARWQLSYGSDSGWDAFGVAPLRFGCPIQDLSAAFAGQKILACMDKIAWILSIQIGVKPTSWVLNGREPSMMITHSLKEGRESAHTCVPLPLEILSQIWVLPHLAWVHPVKSGVYLGSSPRPLGECSVHTQLRWQHNRSFYFKTCSDAVTTWKNQWWIA